MRVSSGAVIATSVAAVVVVLVPLALLWVSRRQRSGAKDRMDEKQLVKKKKDKIVKTTTIKKDDVRSVFDCVTSPNSIANY